MMLHLLTPSMEHSEEPNLCSKMLGGGCYFKQRFCSRLEENPVDYARPPVSAIKQEVNWSRPSFFSVTFRSRPRTENRGASRGYG